MSLSEKHSVRSGSHVSSSSVSVKSDWSKDDMPDFSETQSNKTFQYKTLESDFHPQWSCNNFRDLQCIFQGLESKMFNFLKKELKNFKKILQKENTQYLVKDFNENRCSIREAALDLTLYFLREMKQDEAADTLEDELFFIHQLKCGLQKKYQCVFEGIAQQGDSTLLKNIYTDLYITQGGREQVNTEHEVRQIEVASRRHEAQEIQVECRRLFEASEQDKQIRTVLTKGVAGIGKSVSVQKFVLDWAEGKENQEISFIFPLPFREMNLKEKEKLSLMELITQFFPETKGLNLTRRNRFKVLFILDGLDECRLSLNFAGNEMCRDVSSPASLDVLLTNLIKGNLLPSALIWITSRPAAASKIPPDCIERLTEIRGFNDAQKEEYFRKRLTDENQAKEIIDHVKQSKSLFIMCHIPVFCWISATVLQNILQEKRNTDVKNNQADDASKTLQESNTEDTPTTLTQMYTHFLRFQIQQSRRKYKGEYTPDVSWDKDAILSLGKLAFDNLQKNNLIFYDTDLEACGIDVHKASVYSGMCTQIFKEETGIVVGTMYCFVHLSVQEFIAALYAHLILNINKKSVFDQDSKNRNESMIDLLKTAVDKALESDNGHLDLFLRFLLGLSLQSNQRLLRGLFAKQYHNNTWNIWGIWKILQYFFRTADQQQEHNDQSKEEIVQYIKQKFEANLSPERSINLFYCLIELNDQTLVKEIQTHLSTGSLSSADLSPGQWSAVAFVLLTSEEEIEEFELQKFKKSDECLIRLSAVIKTCKRALLSNCGLTGKSCSALASVLRSDSSRLKDLVLSNNNLQDSGVKLLSDGLKDGCKVEKLSLSDCSISEEGYKALASALRSNPSHLIELDLRGNDPGQSGVKELTELQKGLWFKKGLLKTLRFLSPAADEGCQFVTAIVGENPLLLKELNLSDSKLGDTRVNQLSALLQDKHCKLKKLKLRKCGVTEKSGSALASVLRSDSSSLKDLDLSNNNMQDSGVKLLSDGLKDSKLEKLSLSDCSISEEGYKALASALRSNPSHLIELDLRGNDPGQTGVQELTDVRQDLNHKIQLRFLPPDAEKAFTDLTNIVTENPLLLRKLNLSAHKLVPKLKELAPLLADKHCKINTLTLKSSRITEDECRVLITALNSNPSNLKELDLSETNLGDSGMKILSTLLENKQCRLEKLNLNGVSIGKAGCAALASAFISNPSNLKELDLSRNQLGDSGVTQISALLGNSQCTLQIISLSDCSISEEGYKALASALRSNPSHLIELDLRGNDPGQTGVQELTDLLQDPQCKLKLRFLSSDADDVIQFVNGIVGKNPLLLKELELSDRQLRDTTVKKLSVLLQDKHCKISALTLNISNITEEDCAALTSAFNLNPSNLKELNLSGNKLGNSGIAKICPLLENKQCGLEKLRLNNNSISKEGCAALTSAFISNPSHLIELDLSGNKLGDLGLKNICCLLQNAQCRLEKVKLSRCNITAEGFKALALALKSKPLHQIKLDLTGNYPGPSGIPWCFQFIGDDMGVFKNIRFLSSPDAVETNVSTTTTDRTGSEQSET